VGLIGYARISTSDQNPQLQLDALAAIGCARIFSEAMSGSIRERPQLRAAFEFLRPGDTFVVWKLDRLARSLAQLIDTIDTLHKLGCAFRSLTESIDTSTAGGRLTFHIFGALAEFERGIIRERTIAGLKAARAQGRRGGRPTVMSAERLMAAKGLLEKGQLTIRQVAEQLGVSEATIYKHIPQPRVLSLDPL
jgi:DNA invertase Pin-like site-specific DNA recombinase